MYLKRPAFLFFFCLVGTIVLPSAYAVPRPPLVVTTATDVPALPVEIRANDPAIRYVGRFDTTKGDPRCEWSASTVVLKFQGTNLNVQMEDPGQNYWEIEIDGQPVKKMALGTGSHCYQIASGLAVGKHLVRLVRATEAYCGPTQFHGFQLNQGGALLPAPVPAHRLEVIGDSISCGDSNEGKPNSNDPSNVGENAYFSYGAITARNLGVDYVCLAWSGRSMWPKNTVPEIYDRSLPTEKDSTWDFSKWTPDAIVINLSSNDFGNKTLDQAGWIKAYESFISLLRGHFPNAEIYCATSVMLSGERLDSSKTCLKQIVSDLNAAGDKKVQLLEFASEDGNDGGIGGHGHPSVKTHQIMVDKLSAQLTKDLEWVPSAP